MEITLRDAIAVLHGMGLGGFCSWSCQERDGRIWKPAGPLSGVTGWPSSYGFWRGGFFRGRGRRGRTRTNWTAAVMIIAALLLTFPPLMDLLQGK